MDIENTQQPGIIPTDCPAGKLFVPENQRTQVIQFIHTSPSSGHSGIKRTSAMVRQRFWWPTLATGVKFMDKLAHFKLLKGLLEPILIPRIAVDFITDLISSNGYIAGWCPLKDCPVLLTLLRHS